MEKLIHEELAFICGRWPLDPKRPTLICIHGSGESSLTWQAQVEGLRERANTVALDLPGHGASGGRASRTVAGYAAVVAKFISDIHAPGPIPCGLSLGGAIVQQLLLEAGERFRAGIIANSGARLKVLPSIFELIANDMDGYVNLIERMGFSARTPAEVRQPFLASAGRAAPEVVAGDFTACDAFDVMDRLSAIRVPVLIISGEDDRLTPPKYGEYLERRIPGAVRAHIREAGHFTPVEQPAEVNAAIAGFLDANQF